jgi:S1-C subfamily serine protease
LSRRLRGAATLEDVRARQVAVPLVAALVGGAVTAAVLTASDATSDAPVAQQGLLAAAGGEEQLTVREIYERSAPSVVAIRARSIQAVGSPFEDSTGGAVEDLSTGSGFVIDEDGHIVTSAHVVSGVTDVQVTFSDLRTVAARVVGKDEETDLAVLAVDPEGLDLEPLELGDSDAIRAGDRAVAIANPSGLEPTAGTGTVSSERTRVETPGGVVLRDVIETDAVIQPASSGGPLVGGDGRVIGVSSGIAAREAGVGAVVPANTAREVLDELEERHKVIRPYLGLRGRTTPNGVVVLDPYTGSPAEQAGLLPGDTIETIDDRPVRTLSGLMSVVAEHSPGESVTLRVLRDGVRGDVEVDLTERPASLPPG